VHLRRQDRVGQAVSWARAEQTGYWQDGDRRAAEPRLDLGSIHELMRTIRAHEAAWAGWFADQGITPYRVTYEEVTADPGPAVLGILDHLDIQPPAGWRPRPRERRQADGTNAAWARSYREAHDPE
jgi:trehalose 2-sulfotransferase